MILKFSKLKILIQKILKETSILLTFLHPQFFCYFCVALGATPFFTGGAMLLMSLTHSTFATIVMRFHCATLPTSDIIVMFSQYVLRPLLTVCCCCLPDLFQGMGAWRKTMETQKPGNSTGPGPEVVKR